LYGKEQSFHIDIEYRVKELLGDFSEGRIFCGARVGKHNIETTLLLLNLGEESFEVTDLRYISCTPVTLSPMLSTAEANSFSRRPVMKT
jgi:hypothetical protein